MPNQAQLHMMECNWNDSVPTVDGVRGVQSSAINTIGEHVGLGEYDARFDPNCGFVQRRSAAQSSLAAAGGSSRNLFAGGGRGAQAWGAEGGFAAPPPLSKPRAGLPLSPPRPMARTLPPAFEVPFASMLTLNLAKGKVPKGMTAKHLKRLEDRQKKGMCEKLGTSRRKLA
jgi:hypothetical protein